MFKKYLITGLLIWVPLAVTLWVLDAIVSTMDRTLLLLPAQWQPRQVIGFDVPGLGAVLTLLVVFATGLLAHNFIGRRLVHWWEQLLARIPIVRSIYSSVKQVSDTMLSPKGNAFRQAVLVEFPQRGQWAVGFLIGSPGASVARALQDDMVSVFVPTAPNPTSGYTILVRPSEVKALDITVDEALKFIISLGVVAPGEARARGLRPAALTSDPAREPRRAADAR
ncbi:MAG: DUF502 domain-containing protein [Sutterellaceae bacterium]|nr:DUF502 domain-containing protein [Burkholderiaceae bacterium]MCX7901136.1 DUF502 domain-containing protein [Burkholderiaceae bacterium]MDW8430066.1 DUF502 domain-containing protein [Sutterellaceae bacterium]